MPPLTNMLISASAGTGKTYQLSLRFLGLLALNGGNHPERLIAITFTRKAAGEFKDRILTDLAAGATDEAGAARLKERLWAVIKGTDGEPGLWPGAPEAWKEENLHRERFLIYCTFWCRIWRGSTSAPLTACLPRLPPPAPLNWESAASA